MITRTQLDSSNFHMDSSKEADSCYPIQIVAAIPEIQEAHSGTVCALPVFCREIS